MRIAGSFTLLICAKTIDPLDTHLAWHQYVLVDNVLGLHLEVCRALASQRLLLEVDFGFGLFCFHCGLGSL